MKFIFLFPIMAQHICLEGMDAGIGNKDPSALVELYERKYRIRVRKGDT